MTKDESKQARAVMQAWEEGRTIQAKSRFREDSRWYDLDVDPQWNWFSNEYRVKPEPREFWLWECSAGLFGASTEPRTRPSIHVREVL